MNLNEEGRVMRLMIVVVLWSLVSFAEAKEVVNDSGGVLKVDWSSVDNSYIRKTRSRPTVLQQAVKDVTMPVYLPKDYLNEKDISVVADENFYTISINLSDVTLIISGDRTYQREIVSGGEELKKSMQRVASKFIRSEGIMSTDFNRHGVNYTLSVECVHPNRDKRCTKDTFLRKIYNELVLMGGKQ